MMSVDTNVLVRVAVKEEHPSAATRAQCEKAKALLLSGEALFIPVTVIQELEWVLRAGYEMNPDDVAGFLEDLLSVENIQVDRAAAIAQSVALYRQGFDFSDAVHWAQSGLCSGLATFDRKFLKLAASKGLQPPVI